MTAEANGVLADAIKVLAAHSRAADTEDAPVFRFQSVKDLLNRPAKTWLIDRIIGPGDIGMIYGAPGCGKTFVGIDLIISACAGQSFAAGEFTVTRPITVAYCAGEGLSGLGDRFSSAMARYGMDDLPGFFFSETVPQLYQAPMGDSIGRFVTDWQAQGGGALDLLFVDTLHSATVGADENSAEDMGRVLAECKAAVKALGCAVFLVHHSNKNGTGERGSSALRGAMDVMIEIKRLNDEDAKSTKAQMNCTKLKDGERWESLFFDLPKMVEGCAPYVNWNRPGVTEPTERQGKEDERRQGLLLWMSNSKNIGKRFTAADLAQVAAVSQQQAIKLLKVAVSRGQCECELRYPDRERSNTNPITYYVNVNGDGDGDKIDWDQK